MLKHSIDRKDFQNYVPLININETRRIKNRMNSIRLIINSKIWWKTFVNSLRFGLCLINNYYWDYFQLRLVELTKKKKKPTNYKLSFLTHIIARILILIHVHYHTISMYLHTDLALDSCYSYWNKTTKTSTYLWFLSNHHLMYYDCYGK